MLTVRIEGLDELKRKMSDMERKQLPFAAAKALTRCAQIAQANASMQIRQKLDRPTRYSMDMLFNKPATKTNLTAMLYVKDGLGGSITQKTNGKSQADVLGHLFTGGKREWKRFEKLMHQAGIMPTNMSAIPGDAAPLDAYGNIPRAFIVQLLAYFKAFGEQGSLSNMTDRTRSRFEKKQGRAIAGAGVQYFIVKNKRGANGLYPGIWKRVTMYGGSAVKPIIIFGKRRPEYARRFDLLAIMEDARDDNFAQEFNEAMAEAIRTAR